MIVRVALDEGGLTGAVRAGVKFESGDWRRDHFRGDRPAQVHERVTRIVDDLGIGVSDMAETALRYVLSAPAVSSVAVGMRRRSTVERNARIDDGHGLPAGQLAALRRHRWDRNFYT